MKMRTRIIIDRWRRAFLTWLFRVQIGEGLMS